MVTCLNNPPGKKVVARALRRSSLVVQRLVQFRLKSCVQVRLKSPLNPILPKPYTLYGSFCVLHEFLHVSLLWSEQA